MLFLEMKKIKLNGGHIETMLFIEMEIRELAGGVNWNYAFYRDEKKKN